MTFRIPALSINTFSINTFSIKTLTISRYGIMTLSIKVLLANLTKMTFSHNDTQQSNAATMPNAIKLTVTLRYVYNIGR
jgi:hypothetical protein